jgi:hypothetical protein
MDFLLIIPFCLLCALIEISWRVEWAARAVIASCVSIGWGAWIRWAPAIKRWLKLARE